MDKETIIFNIMVVISVLGLASITILSFAFYSDSKKDTGDYYLNKEVPYLSLSGLFIPSIDGDKVDGGTYYLLDGKTSLIISNNAREKMISFFILSGDNEYSACLVGENNGGLITIDNLEEYRLGNPIEVLPSHCDNGSVGYIHKHPNRESLPSHKDLLNSYHHFNNEGMTIELIHYGENNIAITTKEDWFVGVGVEI